MNHDLGLTLEEMQVVDVALRGLLLRARISEGVDRDVERQLELLRSVRRKLHRTATAFGPQGTCKNCRERPRRGNTDHCARCTTYRRKYGRLPSKETLLRSAARELRRRESG